MKIIKTKEITPADISSLDDNLKDIFNDRTKLHNETIPPFFAYIQDYAWEAFLSHGNNVYETIRHEAQGILLGKYFKDKYGEFVVATKYAEGDGNSTQSFVEMTEERLAEISIQCQNEDLLMLIWLHTHPGFGVFYSGTDISCLKTNFYKKYHAGIVVDILKKHVKGYKTINSDVKEFQEYSLINSNTFILEKPFSFIEPGTNKKVVSVTKESSVEKELLNFENKLKGIEEIQLKNNDTINSNKKDIEKLIFKIKNSYDKYDAFETLSQEFIEIANACKTLNDDTNIKLTTSLKEIKHAFNEFKENLNQLSKESKTEQNNIYRMFEKAEEANNFIFQYLEKIEKNTKSSFKRTSSFSRKTNFNTILLIIACVLTSLLVLLNGLKFIM